MRAGLAWKLKKEAVVNFTLRFALDFGVQSAAQE